MLKYAMSLSCQLNKMRLQLTFSTKTNPYATTTCPGRGRHAVDDGRMIFQIVSVILKCLTVHSPNMLQR